MRFAIILLFSFCFYLPVCCQYTSIDTVIWKHNAGYRSELYQLDSILVKEIVDASNKHGCDTIIDFLHRSKGELRRYSGYVNGFSDEIRVYAFKLSVLDGRCITELLDNWDIPAKVAINNYLHSGKASNYPFINELNENIEIYLPSLTKLLLNTDYRFKYREIPDPFARKNIALLLDEIVKSIPLDQLEQLSEERKNYISSLLL